MDDEVVYASRLADLAASISVPRFRQQDFSVTTKPDGSPVTDVDVAIETALRASLARDRPGDMVTGEELGDTGPAARRWYLDPIDGTKRFIAGDPAWMTLIALAVDDRLVLGIVDFPALGERWWAVRGRDAFHDGRRLRVSTRARLADATVGDTWRGDLAAGNRAHPIYAVAERCAEARPNRGHSFLAVACGEAEIAVSVGSFAWDYAPLKLLVEEAGGRFTDFDGSDRIDTHTAVATNGPLHAEVLELLRNAR